MLRTLLESNAPRPRRRASTAASIIVHTAAIAGAIVATASARTGLPPTAGIVENPPFYVPMPDAAKRPARPASDPERRAGQKPIDEPPVDQRTIVFTPNAEPSTPIELDPRRLLAADTIGLGLPRRPIGGEVVGGVVGDGPATAATVDKPAAMVAPPQPRYPDVLRSAGVTGRVIVRLVVDTAGRVEPASVVIRESSHDLFAQAVRAVLPSLRFSAAEAGGRKVRMLVDLPFEFRLQQ